MATALTPAGDRCGAAAGQGRQALRRELIAKRLALPAGEWSAGSERISAHLIAGLPQLATMAVAFYWPQQQEPDLRPLIVRWISDRQAGFSALLPVVIGDHQALAFRAWQPDTAMVSDRYGIPTPAAGDFVCPQALLLPVNGFDAAGYRIGYGGGYFDRTLALLRPRPLTIAVGFELARLVSINPEPHDQRVDFIVTECGLFRTAG